MVWGGVSQHHRTELAGNLNAVRYREDILQHDNAILLPSAASPEIHTYVNSELYV